MCNRPCEGRPVHSKVLKACAQRSVAGWKPAGGAQNAIQSQLRERPRESKKVRSIPFLPSLSGLHKPTNEGRSSKNRGFSGPAAPAADPKRNLSQLLRAIGRSATFMTSELVRFAVSNHFKHTAGKYSRTFFILIYLFETITITILRNIN